MFVTSGKYIPALGTLSMPSYSYAMISMLAIVQAAPTQTPFHSRSTFPRIPMGFCYTFHYENIKAAWQVVPIPIRDYLVHGFTYSFSTCFKGQVQT